MSKIKTNFLQLALDAGVLRFGEFTLKSGRVSPYFFNAGLFNSGEALHKLGCYYAQTLVDSNMTFDMLYGPAYKGIPLVSATSIALSAEHQINKPYAFNRKEAKDHGEGGTIVGAPIQGKVIIVDDVISAGTSVRESFDIIQQAGGEVAGVLIALDRQEKGQGEQSAIQEIQAQYGIPVAAIACLADLIDFVAQRVNDTDLLSRIQNYRDTYGV